MILDLNEICSKVDVEFATFIHSIVTIIKIAIPLILVLFGMLDFGKGVIASKEDEIKKGQNNFIKRLMAAAIVFFMVTIIQLVINIVDKDSDGEFWACANSLLNGKTSYHIETQTSKDYEEEEIKTKNPEGFKACCELNDGRVTQDNRCVDSDGKRVPSDWIISCTQNVENKMNQKYANEKKSCCESFGGTFANNKCTDRNGGTVSEDNVSNCVINTIRRDNTDGYNTTCCNELGGNVVNGSCKDYNGGTIPEQSINSCIFSKLR